MNKVIKYTYIGAGLDPNIIKEILDEQKTSNIIITMLDPLPFNTPDLVQYCIKHGHSYENKEWLDEMIKTFTSFDDCKIISHNTEINLIIFEYNHKNGITITVKYYYASPFPEILDVKNCHSIYNPSEMKCNAILADITGYRVLHIAGYTPHSSILNYASEIIYISGSTGTVYKLDDKIKDDEDNVIFYDRINQMIKSGRIRNWSYQKLIWNDDTNNYDYIKTITRKATLDNIFKFEKTAVYIGAGLYIPEFPGNHLRKYHEIICMDKAPGDTSMNMYMTDVSTLIKSFQNGEWKLIDKKEDIDLLVFTKTVEEGKTITIKYYYSTRFPFNEKKENDDKIKAIVKDISAFDALICHNYTPHSSIFKYSSYSFDLILSSMDYFRNIKEYIRSLVGDDYLYNLDNIVMMQYKEDDNSESYIFEKNVYEKAFEFLF